jgi:hypothetical protein
LYVAIHHTIKYPLLFFRFILTYFRILKRSIPNKPCDDIIRLDRKMENKNKGITLVIAMIAAASLLSLGAVAAPAYAGGDGDGVKQKAEAEADCDQKNKVNDGNANPQTNTMGACVAAAVNINELIVVGGGNPFAASTSEASTGEFSAPSTP